MQINQESPRTFLIAEYKKELKTPFFFPAVSTVKTNFTPIEYVDLLKKVQYPGYLVSAYDIYHAEDKVKKELIKKVSESTERGFFTFLDSGNYESFWHNDNKWSIKQLETILKNISVDFCFSYDLFWNNKQNEYISETITLVAKTASLQRRGTTVPIIHSIPDLMPKIIKRIVEQINPEIVSVPERDLGSNLFERAKTVKCIRDELNKTEIPIPLHLLGTGNPISILIYSLCGADMYDGLEWCKNVVNPETGQLLHFVQKDLMECSCRACRSDNVSYPFQTMAHNLNFYQKFISKINKSFKNNNFNELLEEYIDRSKISKIKKIAGVL